MSIGCCVGQLPLFYKQYMFVSVISVENKLYPNQGIIRLLITEKNDSESLLEHLFLLVWLSHHSHLYITQYLGIVCIWKTGIITAIWLHDSLIDLQMQLCWIYVQFRYFCTVFLLLLLYTFFCALICLMIKCKTF